MRKHASCYHAPVTAALPDPFMITQANGIQTPSPAYARAFLGLVRAAETLDRGLDLDLKARHGIGLRGFEVLLHLAAFSLAGSLRMSELTAQAPLSQSRVSRLVAELEQQGLVTRSTDESDTRGRQVSITDRGIAVFDQAKETHFAGLHERLFDHLSWTEVKALARITAKLLAVNGDGSALDSIGSRRG